MSVSVAEKCYPVDLGGNFTEDAPRPPVPGEEGELVSGDARQYGYSFCAAKSEASTATPRRPDLDLGYEPEGSASPTPPYVKWAESLHSLLDDQDGIHLFRTFLKQENCADLLDFWFACSGFRKLEAGECGEEKKLKLAKAIYRKYILDNNGIVSRQIKPATKSFIKECVMKLYIDPAMFDQAQTEIQTMMEENTYPVFLKSDIYLEYTRTGGESPKLYGDQSSSLGNGKVPPGYLPTLNEDEEWRYGREQEEQRECQSAPSNRLTEKLLMETAPQRAVGGRRYQGNQEYRHATWREPINPYYINTGYARAPATSANDSEQQSMSSDADTISLTDSSVDGISPYRYRKPNRREMQESAKTNGRVPLPHIPRTQRMPKDVHVDPDKFAAELISRLECVLREREAQEKLEERLRRVRQEEEGDEADISTAPSLVSHKIAAGSQHYGTRYCETTYNVVQLRDAHEEDPESILDEHVQRVMKTPSCQSPGNGHYSPKTRSPDGLPGPGKHPAKGVPKSEPVGVYHHKHAYHGHHGGGVKPKEHADPETPQRSTLAWTPEPHHYAGRARFPDSSGPAPGPLDPLGHSGKGGVPTKRASKKAEPGVGLEALITTDDLERNQKIIQWMMEGEKEAGRQKRSPYGSIAGAKKSQGHDASRVGSVERPGAVYPWVSTQLWNGAQPSHPFIQDPTMPPNPAPNPLTQLEEARRRLEEERKKLGAVQMKPRHKAAKKPACENITVAYYFCGEPIPYRTSVKGRVVTLGQFKELLTKKGLYRYYFKKVSDEFDCGVVFEEVRDDDAVLPIFEEKIIGKVEKID
ncbi:axin-1-like [Brienomyrus brachyistius]|uniref:axin-1-like n=1 Tax=Brienomyrus brachyistius TaxID=42636 RepID=UPI0020B188A0|nr:axin-1-like [Brienomyrus brachyistius]XP_048870689.1 axin-1-like [Brienomyrus brachyistius]XP_048870690.1 axin-1-like [Brienomyrus brachyistius]XP_048870691.1 axin-1-like [Brienomyrus brachyistius]